MHARIPNHTVSTRNHMQQGTELPPYPYPTPPSFLSFFFFFYLHLFIYFPFHRVSWFSASFIFRRSPFFFHLCHILSVILLSIFAVRKGRGGGGGGTGRLGGGRRGVRDAAVYSCQTADVLQLLSGPCDAGDAAEGLRRPAKSAIFCPYPARSAHQWRAASVSQRRG